MCVWGYSKLSRSGFWSKKKKKKKKKNTFRVSPNISIIYRFFNHSHQKNKDPSWSA